ncbi:MAG: hypothetical protein KGN16_12945 [Burkholderiales bacterium]|nr:hypothetical protein [Burkholderiales bacterium]
MAALATFALAGALGGAAAPALAQTRAGAMAAVAPMPVEKNPPGDISDNQAFVAWRSPLGFSIQVPEGWARHDLADGALFSDKYNAVRVTVTPSPAAPSIASVRANEVAALQRLPKAVEVLDVRALTLPAGPAVVVRYRANSDPNPVTDKAIRLDCEGVFLWRAGRLATMTLSAPVGADNVDPWRVVTRSFAWAK